MDVQRETITRTQENSISYCDKYLLLNKQQKDKVPGDFGFSPKSKQQSEQNITHPNKMVQTEAHFHGTYPLP